MAKTKENTGDLSSRKSRFRTIWSISGKPRLEHLSQQYDLNTKTVMVFFLNYHEKLNTYEGLQNILQVVDRNGNPVKDCPFRFDIIEIPRIIKHVKNLPPGQELGLLEKWLMFFQDPDDKQLEAIMDTDPTFKKAKARLRILSEDEQNQIEAMMREKAIVADELERRAAKHEGLQEGEELGLARGLEKGREEGRTDTIRFIVRQLSQNGSSPAEIGKIVQMTETEIEAILLEPKLPK